MFYVYLFLSIVIIEHSFIVHWHDEALWIMQKCWGKLVVPYVLSGVLQSLCEKSYGGTQFEGTKPRVGFKLYGP